MGLGSTIVEIRMGIPKCGKCGWLKVSGGKLANHYSKYKLLGFELMYLEGNLSKIKQCVRNRLINYEGYQPR